MKIPLLLILFSSMMFSGQVDSVSTLKKPVKLYFKEWIPGTRTLSGGLKKTETKDLEHVEATVSPNGLIRRVSLKTREGRPYLTYDLFWNKEKTWSRYKITADIDTTLTVLNDLILAHDLSDLRPGYKVIVSDRRNGDIEKLEVYDDLGGFLYYYTIEYTLNSKNTETVKSRYFKYDSTLVGYHELEYDKRGRLRGVDYFTSADVLKYSLGYQYNPKNREVSRSIIDVDGVLLEKRIMPMDDKYLRKARREKSGVSLSEAVNFLENASEEDIDALALILEQRYRKEINRVDTTYSPIINITDTLVVEKEVPVIVEGVPEQRERQRTFRYSMELGGAVLSGTYFNDGQPLSFGINVNTFRKFKIWFFPAFKPVLTGAALNYNSKISPGIKAGLILPGYLPFRIPFELTGQIGWSNAGPELNGSMMLLRSKKLVMGIKTEATIYPNVFSSNSLTGMVSVKLLIGF